MSRIDEPEDIFIELSFRSGLTTMATGGVHMSVREAEAVLELGRQCRGLGLPLLLTPGHSEVAWRTDEGGPFTLRARNYQISVGPETYGFRVPLERFHDPFDSTRRPLDELAARVRRFKASSERYAPAAVAYELAMEEDGPWEVAPPSTASLRLGAPEAKRIKKMVKACARSGADFAAVHTAGRWAPGPGQAAAASLRLDGMEVSCTRQELRAGAGAFWIWARGDGWCAVSERRPVADLLRALALEPL